MPMRAADGTAGEAVRAADGTAGEAVRAADAAEVDGG